MRIFLVCLWLGLLAGNLPAQTLPEGFQRIPVYTGPERLTGLRFDEAGRLYVWEKGGRLYRLVEGQLQQPPLLDLSEEVGDWRDHGLLSVALDPDFLQNGYLYLLYVVDRHHWQHEGKPTYDPQANHYFDATFGRLTRYTLNVDEDFSAVRPGSRKVLLGTGPQDGIPILHESHGVGDLAFGLDGSLLLSCGDGTTYNDVATAWHPADSYAGQGLADSILRPETNVGAFRAQSIESLSGKVLRLDPATGAGLPSNPFFDPAHPRSPRSRSWALGLRNPFRLCLRPETGRHDPTAGQPGTFVLGDVGWSSWEELNVVTGPGQNFGWPLYEGFAPQGRYFGWRTANPAAPNSRFEETACEPEFFAFQDLLAPPLVNRSPHFPHPCDSSRSVETAAPRFVHRSPAIAWSHGLNPPARTQAAFFDDLGQQVVADLTDPRSPVSGTMFQGYCSIGGCFYAGENFPEAYHGAYFQADYSQRWIRAFFFDEQAQLRRVEPFFQGREALPIALATSPQDGCLYYLDYETGVFRFCFEGNVPPEVQVTPGQAFGAAPLEVTFDASTSSDPEGGPVSFRWQLPDTQLSGPILSYSFEAAGVEPEAVPVTLTVTDTAGAVSRRELLVSLNNSPPAPTITGLAAGYQYPVSEPSELSLTAIVADAEHSAEEMHYAWQVFLHHNTHYHSEAIDTARAVRLPLSPVGCETETFYYRIRLTVTDPAGLSGTDEREIFPDCVPMVEIDSLWAEVVGDRVALRWAVQAEDQVAYYEWQRSPDRLNFLPIGQVPASDRALYHGLDAQPEAGRRWYRLRAEDRDGVSLWTEPVAVDYEPLGEIQLYPQPAGDWLEMDLNRLEGEGGIRLWDLQGRPVLTWKGTEVSFRLDLRELPAGLYLYEAWNGLRRQRGKIWHH